MGQQGFLPSELMQRIYSEKKPIEQNQELKEIELIKTPTEMKIKKLALKNPEILKLIKVFELVL